MFAIHFIKFKILDIKKTNENKKNCFKLRLGMNFDRYKKSI